jgi:hypothetical protein
MRKKTYTVSLVLCLHKTEGAINIINVVNHVDAQNEHEALGMIIEESKKEFPAHYVHTHIVLKHK